MTTLIQRIINREKKHYEWLIKEQSSIYETTLDEDTRKNLIKLHDIYKMRFKKEYKE